MGELLNTPVCKVFNSPVGKTIAQFKALLVESINEVATRPLYIFIPAGSNIPLNINNDEYIIEDGASIACWITSIPRTGNYAHIEFTSYNFRQRYYATMLQGVITGY